MDQIEIPIAFCRRCKEEVPVTVIDKMTFNGPEAPQELKDLDFDLVICPICDSILNLNGPIKITYYDLSDVEFVTNFRAETDE